MCTLTEAFASEKWRCDRSKIPLALGENENGLIIADLAEMPHCLIAGQPGSGKSTFLHAFVLSVLNRFSPSEVQLVLLDPTGVEFSAYTSVPHLKLPVVIEARSMALALNWAVFEAKKRYAGFQRVNARNLWEYNARQNGEIESKIVRISQEGDEYLPSRLPVILLMLDGVLGSFRDEIERDEITARLNQVLEIGRAAGIHAVIAESARSDLLKPSLKAHLPSRIAFRVTSPHESRIIIGTKGAEKLNGAGSLFYRPSNSSALIRCRSLTVTTQEIEDILRSILEKFPTESPAFSPSPLPASDDQDISEVDEELISRSLQVIRQEKRASTSMLQRRLRIGYTQAVSIIDTLEKRGILGPGEGAKPRQILVDLDILLGTDS